MTGLHSAWVLLVAVPFAAAWLWRLRSRGSGVRYSSAALARGGGASWRVRLAWVPGALRVVAVALLLIAAARPRAGIGEVRTTVDGVALMLVVDRSYSMSERMPMDGALLPRIDVVKDVVRRFALGDEAGGLGGRERDLMGLVTFSRFAETAAPLTQDHEVLVRLVEGVRLTDPRDRQVAGTAIGEGLALAAARLRAAEEEIAAGNEGEVDPGFEIASKAVVLMTDGAENVGAIRALEAADLCAELGIKVYAVGIGGGGGSRFGTYDERVLREIADRTGGAFFSARDAEALRGVYGAIDELETTEIRSVEYTEHEERFLWWALAGLGALGLELLLGATLLRRVP